MRLVGSMGGQRKGTKGTTDDNVKIIWSDGESDTFDLTRVIMVHVNITKAKINSNHGIGIEATANGRRATIVRIEGHNYSRWFRDFSVDNGFGAYEIITRTFIRDGRKHVRGRRYSGLVPHALRHTQATLLIGGGADIKTVQARLGHASPSTTLSIYAHALEANDRRAATKLDAFLSPSTKTAE